ncbi:MAG: TIR domain-containing protein [Fermentimonas sp.]
MKRKIFIGSSREGLSVAEKIKDAINEKCQDWLDCELWNEGKVFSINNGTLDSLIKASRKYDYGIFIASNDDTVSKRRKRYKTMRDNVLFEMGLFLGSLGLNRAFLITHSEISLPSDFNGVTMIRYSNNDINDDKINDIIAELNKTKNSFCLKPIPSATLAMGYYEDYIYPLLKNLSDIQIQFELEICIPKKLSKIEDQIAHYIKETSSSKVFNERPTVYKYGGSSNKYWDIPTTLKTLQQIIDLIITSEEIGKNQEKEEWIEYELRNFEGTLKVLIKKQPIYKDKVIFKYI